ncbi:CPBP family intramembrane glutamic endopeptidase [Natrononativus amylolyticus]|uniref:CPBP family intramembrane glutamic endopeptidase n=1 Tax=Natrononativus amylolyticus TaxID=2963434 RepID=UPI0020CCD390|nr:CPBP family intramembrane glutamic endopeptidase [Natrononativus amylolyticus]
MTQWAAFAGFSGVVLVLLLALSHLTQSTLDGADDRQAAAAADRETVDDAPTSGGAPPEPPEDAAATVGDASSETAAENGRAVVDPDGPALTGTGSEDPEPTSTELAGDGVSLETRPAGAATDDTRLETDLSTGMLLANVALSQGVFAVLLVAAAVYTAVPAAALGVEFSASYLWTGLAVGTAAGLGLYALNELGSASATRLGFDHDEELRELLAPDSRGGWLVLLFVVLPLIAFFEEFLFRAALIGALSVGFDLSPWLLAVLSSVAFALGHGVQGPVGVAVTGALGFVLAALFIYTGSLLVVVVAHYLINALEFAVHEGLGIEWGETTGS